MNNDAKAEASFCEKETLLDDIAMRVAYVDGLSFLFLCLCAGCTTPGDGWPNSFIDLVASI